MTFAVLHYLQLFSYRQFFHAILACELGNADYCNSIATLANKQAIGTEAVVPDPYRTTGEGSRLKVKTSMNSAKIRPNWPDAAAPSVPHVLPSSRLLPFLTLSPIPFLRSRLPLISPARESEGAL